MTTIPIPLRAAQRVLAPPTMGSLFAGIGGFDLGFERAGMVCRWQVEWDRACQRVLARHWPDVRRYGDIRTVKGTELERVDVITFGSPCQDLSVAGRRSGLAGDRSRLFYEAIRIIRDVRPAFAVWENVPGALSTNGGDDFACVLAALADAGAVDIAWRVLDAQWFGVAQRRRRLFVVADFRAERAAQILFEPESCGGHPPARREARETVAGTPGGGAGSSGWTPDTDRMTFVPVAAFVEGSRNGIPDLDAVYPTLTATQPSETSHYQQGIFYFAHTLDGQAVIRRLTPIECERLQGFPDEWTRWGADDEEVSDTARYRMLGNAVCVNVAEWIGRRLVAALRTKPGHDDRSVREERAA